MEMMRDARISSSSTEPAVDDIAHVSSDLPLRKGYCESCMASIQAMASIYKDSGIILRGLSKNDEYTQLSRPLYRLILLRLLWLFLSIGVELAISFPFKWIMTALAEKNSALFFQGCKFYFLVVILAIPILAMDKYLTSMIYVTFRDTTTQILLSRYYSQYIYYYMSSLSSIDAPGQRLDMDVDNWTWGLVLFSSMITRQIGRLFGWCAVLYAIGANMIIYAFVTAVLIIIVGIAVFAGKLTYIAYLISRDGADFRAGVIHTRDNAETIAFYGASSYEEFWTNQRLAVIIADLCLQAKWKSGVEGLRMFSQYVGTIMPLVLMSSVYFATDMDLGTIMQAYWAFSSLLLALTVVIAQLDKLSNIQAGGRRVVAVIEAMDEIENKLSAPPIIESGVINSPRSVSNKHKRSGSDIVNAALTEAGQSSYHGISYEYISDDHRLHTHDHDERILFSTDSLSIIVPNTHSLLLYKLNMQVAPFQNVLIVGPSGAGKSSLLRVLRGLWKWGGGHVTRLSDAQVMFLPQKPYLPILAQNRNTLYNQLLFPKCVQNDNNNNNNNNILPEREFQRIFEAINLEYVLHYDNDHNDNNNHADIPSKDWSKLLSLGEQQRLSFGRVAVYKPRMVFLDEATSALDVDNQRKMYQLLQNEHITYMSVGHRPNLVEFHDTVLELVGDGSWRIWTREQYVQGINQ